MKSRKPGTSPASGPRAGKKREVAKTLFCCAQLTTGKNMVWGSIPTQPNFLFPSEPFLLEEANLPPKLAASLAGKRVTVEILPEEQACTRRIQLERDISVVRDEEGNYWNAYQPVRLLFADADGKKWRLPRRWMNWPFHPDRPEITSRAARAATWQEELHLPSHWDLEEINIDFMEAAKAGGMPTVVEVHVAARRPIKVLWRDSTGTVWRIPHDWRRRRIRLPDYDVLVAQDIPPEVALKWAGKAVSVNYHPGSLCCLPDSYRFRDGEGGKWPVKKRDCVLLDYGNREEYRA